MSPLKKEPIAIQKCLLLQRHVMYPKGIAFSKNLLRTQIDAATQILQDKIYLKIYKLR